MTESDGSPRKISDHILPTASNLLGLCFVILSFIKLTARGGNTFVDELVALAILCFFAASVLSYLAVRATPENVRADRYERIADVVFLAGLVTLSLVSVALVFLVI